jgi:hypothetical protein
MIDPFTRPSLRFGRLWNAAVIVLIAWADLLQVVGFHAIAPVFEIMAFILLQFRFILDGEIVLPARFLRSDPRSAL